MNAPPQLEEALQRIAALEAAMTGGALTRTPVSRAAETPVWPKRDPSADRAPASHPGAPDALAVLASLEDAVWSVAPDGGAVLFAAGAVQRLFGHTAPELVAVPGRWLGAVHPDDRDRFRAALARLPDTGALALEHRLVRPGGDVKWALTRGALVRDRAGRPVRVDGTTTETSRRRAAAHGPAAVLEAAGATSGEAFLLALAEALCGALECRAAAVVEWHPDRPRAARTAALWLDGRAPEEPLAFAGGAGLVRDLLAGGRALVPDGARDRFPTDPFLAALRAEALAAEPLCDDTGRLLGFLAVADDRPFVPHADPRAVLKALAPRAAVELLRARDTTPRAELAAARGRAAEAESLLARAADLAAAGRAAAGVAHDLNNLLSVVSGFAEIVRDALPEGHPKREAASAVVRSAGKAAALSARLRALGKPAGAGPVPHDVGAAVRDLEPLLRGAAGHRVALVLDVAERLPLVSADPVQFDRVLLNLVQNACDATAAGTVNVRAAAEGECVVLTVSDTGPGIPPEVRARMFDAYFTTKGASGTGMGLAIVRDAVRAAGGRVDVTSDPGWGTQVRVFWPVLRT